MLHLNIYLPPIFHPGFNRKDGAVAYGLEPNKYEVACMKTNLCPKILEATNKKN